MTRTFAGQGDLVTARQQAVGSIYNTLVTQANLLAYLDDFRVFAWLCVVCLAGALLLKNAKLGPAVAAH
jgi:DHA2 family multidrug resistance protein